MRSKLTSRSITSAMRHNDLRSQPTPNPRAKILQMLANPYLRGASQRISLHASPCIKMHNVHNENQPKLATSHCYHRTSNEKLSPEKNFGSLHNAFPMSQAPPTPTQLGYRWPAEWEPQASDSR